MKMRASSLWFESFGFFLVYFALGCALAGWAAGLRSAARAKSDPFGRSTQYLGFWGEKTRESEYLAGCAARVKELRKNEAGTRNVDFFLCHFSCASDLWLVLLPAGQPGCGLWL